MNEKYIYILDSLNRRSDSILVSHINEKYVNIEQILTKPWYYDNGFISGVLGLIVTIAFGIIAWRFSTKQNNQNEDLSKTTASIKQVTSELQTEIQKLADINRPFYDTFPEIMFGLNQIFKTALANPNESELYVMNRTSAFGKIHIYNPKFYKQYDINPLNINNNQEKVLKQVYKREQEILNHFEDNADKYKYLFREDVELLYKAVEDCSMQLENEKFKIIVFDGENETVLEDLFIKKYFDEVNTSDDIKNNLGLEFYDFVPAPHKGRASIKTDRIKSNLSNKYTIEAKISEAVKSAHNDTIKRIRKGKENCPDDSCWLKYSSEIPMQMYLLHTIVDGKNIYSTFIINAMTSKKRQNNDREINGIFSTEQSIFSVFKTLFDETFNKQ